MTNTTYGSITITNVSDGQTFYTWYIYADDANGTNATLDSVDKEYMGVASNQATPLTQTILDTLIDFSIFSWSQISIKVTCQTEQYYKTDSKDTPSSNDTDWLNEAAWVTTMPNPWEGSSGTKYYVWKRQKTFWSNDTVTYVGLQLLSDYDVATSLAKQVGMEVGAWCKENNITIIDGATIMTGTIHADKIEAGTIGADKLNTDAITSRNYYKKDAEGKYTTELSGEGAKLNLAYGTWDSANFKIGTDGSITATKGTIGGLTITGISSTITKTSEDAQSARDAATSAATSVEQTEVLVGQIKDSVSSSENSARSALEEAQKAAASAGEASASAGSAATDAAIARTDADNALASVGRAEVEARDAASSAAAAQEEATKAATSANAADQRATQAETQAAQANTNAVSAVETANSANAQSASAVQTAQSANETATAANTSATEAKQAANNAVGTANEAKNIADAAVPKVATGDYNWTFDTSNGIIMKSGETEVFRVGQKNDESGLYMVGNGEFTGKITANDGDIGSWIIGEDSLTTGDFGADESVHLYTKGHTTDDASTDKKYFGQDEDKTWMFTIGSNFGVDSSGNLYATGGKIGGLTITKIEGTIKQTSADAQAAKDNAQTATEQAEAAARSASDATTSAGAAQAAAESANASVLATQGSVQAAQASASAAADFATVAQGEAEQAKKDAATAQEEATKAATSAGEAQTLASQADTKSGQAVDAANTANTTANTAKSTADVAKSTAESAQSVAAAAQAKADAAVPKKVETGDYNWIFDTETGIVMTSHGTEVFHVGQKDGVSGLYMKGNGEFSGHIQATSGSFANQAESSLVNKNLITHGNLVAQDYYPLYRIAKTSEMMNGETKISFNDLPIGTKFVLSYKFQTKLGTLPTVGGSLIGMEIKSCEIDGTARLASSYSSAGLEVSGETEHTVVLELEVTGEGAAIGINVAGTIDSETEGFAYELWDIKIEEGAGVNGDYSWSFSPEEGMQMWDGPVSATPVLKVDSEGLHIKGSGEFTGDITASKITGSTFTNDDKSFKIDSNGNITGSTITGSSIEIKEGNTTNFSVTNTGHLTANKGSIAGWTINSDSLTTGNFGENDSIHLYPAGYDTKGASPSNTYFGQADKKWMLGIGSNFGVDSEGNLYAAGGQIGGLTIGSIETTINQTSADAKEAKDNAQKAAGSAGDAQKFAESVEASVLAIQDSVQDAQESAAKAETSALTAQSKAEQAEKDAKQAEKDAGDAATSASEAKTLANDANTNASAAVNTANTAKGTADEARQMASDAVPKKVEEKNYNWLFDPDNGIIMKSGNNEVFKVGEENGELGLYMKGNGEFAGEIIATGGNIGDWYIDREALRDEDSKIVLDPSGMTSLTKTDGSVLGELTFKAGNNFGVTKAGKLYATGADIEGKIVATEGSFSGHIDAASGSFSGHIEADSGKIGGFGIGENKLTAGNGDGFVGIQTTKYSLGHASAEYIESSGAQYINTGICSANNVAIEVDVKLMSPRSTYGSNTGYNYTANETKSYFYYSSDRTQGGFADYKQVREIVKQDGNKCYRNGELVHTFTEITNFNDKWPIYLFGRNAGGALDDYGQVQIYGCKIWQDGNLVRNFEPAYKDGEYCLYESCFGQYYKNNGTGTFNGKLKTDAESIITDDSGNIYRVLEYIESSGSQYIETEVIPTSNMVSEIVFTPTNGLTENAIFGSSWTANGYFLMLYQGKVRWHSGGESVDVGPFNTGDKLTCKCSNSYIYVNGTRYDISGGTNTTNTIELLGLMDYSGSSGRRGIGRIESFKIWNDSGTIIRDYIPVIKNETEYGLYDQVNKKFYGNSGSGAFSGKGIANEFASIYLGSADPEEAPFSITNTGKLKAESGTIGGWTIGQNKLKSEDESIVLDPLGGTQLTNQETSGVNITATDLVLKAGNRFGVTKNGEIFALRGTFCQGINLQHDNLVWYKQGTNNSIIQAILSGTMKQGSARTVNNHTTDKWFIWSDGKFGVDADGYLYASNVDLSGKITATSGKIGSVEIDNLTTPRRNLVRYSREQAIPQVPGYTDGNANVHLTLVNGDSTLSKGKTYYFSSEISLTSHDSSYTLPSQVSVIVYNVTGSSYNAILHEKMSIVNGKIAGPLVIPDNKGEPHKILVYAGVAQQTQYISGVLKNIKLEEGASATIWTEAPEDIMQTENSGSYSWKFSPTEGLFMWQGPQAGTPVMKVGSSGLELTGTISATGGSIGGWDIDEVNPKKSGKVGIFKKFIASDDIGYCTGMMPYGGRGNANIWVGASYGDKGMTPWEIYNALDDADLDTTTWSNYVPFYVSGNGEVHCSKLEATGGSVGGWIIDSNKLYSAHVDGDSNSYGTGIASSTWLSDPVFWAGYTGYGAHPWDHSKKIREDMSGDTEANIQAAIKGDPWWNKTNFSVDARGQMLAKSGKIGSVLIDGAGLYGSLDDGTKTWSLTNSGLACLSNSTIQLGTSQIAIDGSADCTLQSNGKITLQATKSDAEGNPTTTKIILGDASATFSTTVSARYEHSWGKFTFYLTLAKAPPVSIVRTLYWFCYSTKHEDQSGIDVITFMPNQKEYSRTVECSYEIDADQYLGLSLASADQAESQARDRLYSIEDNQSISLRGNTISYTSDTSQAVNFVGSLIPWRGASSQQVVTDYSLGLSTSQWNTLYCKIGEFDKVYTADGTVKTSDRNVKNNIEAPLEHYDKLFDQLRPVRYKYIKNTSDRYHTGFIAQEVLDATVNAGLTSKDFAAFCEWEDNGKTTCGLRYEEFVSLNTWQIQKLKPRMASAEEKLLAYESRISALEKEIENLKKS